MTQWFIPSLRMSGAPTAAAGRGDLSQRNNASRPAGRDSTHGPLAVVRKRIPGGVVREGDQSQPGERNLKIFHADRLAAGRRRARIDTATSPFRPAVEARAAESAAPT